MRINVLRKVCCSIVAFAAFTAMVTSCGTADTGIPVSSELNVTTSDTVAESSESSTEISVDKVIATGIELIDYGQNLKGIKVYRDEREIDGMLYLPEGNGPFGGVPGGDCPGNGFFVQAGTFENQVAGPCVEFLDIFRSVHFPGYHRGENAVLVAGLVGLGSGGVRLGEDGGFLALDEVELLEWIPRRC